MKIIYFFTLCTVVIVLVALTALTYGNVQWSKHVYLWQATVYPKYKDAFIKPYANYTGEWVTYNKQGVITAVNQYKKGRLEGVSKYYYADGTLASAWQFEDDLRSGFCVMYDERGRVKREFFSSKDKMNGIYKEYYLGKVEYIASYKEGLREGLFKKYVSDSSESNNLTTQGLYSQGMKIGLWSLFKKDQISKASIHSREASTSPLVVFDRENHVDKRQEFLSEIETLKAEFEIAENQFYDKLKDFEKRIQTFKNEHGLPKESMTGH